MDLKHNESFQVSPKRKAQLIEKVVNQGKTILYVAKKLRMKYSTARQIIKEYRSQRACFEGQESPINQRNASSPQESQNRGEMPIMLQQNYHQQYCDYLQGIQAYQQLWTNFYGNSYFLFIPYGQQIPFT